MSILKTTKLQVKTLAETVRFFKVTLKGSSVSGSADSGWISLYTWRPSLIVDMFPRRAFYFWYQSCISEGGLANSSHSLQKYWEVL